MKIPDKTSLGESQIQLRSDRHRELEDPHTVPCLQQIVSGRIRIIRMVLGLPIQYHNGIYPDILPYFAIKINQM